MMGLQTTRSHALAKRLEEYQQLDIRRLQKKASRDELAQIKQIRLELLQLPAEDPIQVLSELENLRYVLKDKNDQ